MKMTRKTLLLCLTIGVFSTNASSVLALDFDGFTEPNRTINVAADETGIVSELLVREGDFVKRGQPIAKLNSDIHRALLAIAEQNAQTEGRLAGADAELQLRRERFSKLESLRSEGHARQEEVDRARAEVEISEANVRSITEDLIVKKLEYEKLKTQLDRRTVRSPIAGTVMTLHKQLGEFVAPNTPEILTLVELDPLLANFSMTSHDVERIELGQQVKVRFPANGQLVDGVVDFIAPITDAESGTIRVKVKVKNSESKLRSGERCTLQLRD